MIGFSTVLKPSERAISRRLFAFLRITPIKGKPVANILLSAIETVLINLANLLANAFALAIKPYSPRAVLPATSPAF